MANLFDTPPTALAGNLMTPDQSAVSALRAKANAKLSELSDTDRQQVMAIKNAIVPGDFNSINKFATSVTSYGGQVVDSLLQQVQADKLEGVQKGVNNLLMQVKQVNADDLRSAKKAGFLAKIFPFIFTSKEKIMAKFATASTQIQRTADEIVKNLNQAESDIKTMQMMGENCVKMYNQYEALIAGGELQLCDIRDEIARDQAQLAQSSDNDPMETQNVQAKISFADTLDKKIATMRQLQQVVYIQIPQLGIMIKNNVDISNEFRTIIDQTIPLWKNLFAQEMMLESQRNNVAIITAAKDMTNDQLRRISENLKTTSLEIASQNSRGMIDADTIKVVQDNFIATLNGVTEQYRIGTDARAKAAGEIENMRLEFKKQIQAANSGNNQLTYTR